LKHGTKFPPCKKKDVRSNKKVTFGHLTQTPPPSTEMTLGLIFEAISLAFLVSIHAFLRSNRRAESVLAPTDFPSNH